MEGLRGLGLLVILTAAAITDYRTYEIPDRLHVAGIGWWLLFLFLEPELWRTAVLRGVLGGALISGGLLLLSHVMDYILGRESLGGGDIKLFFVTGLYLGAAGNLLNLMISSVLGIVVCLAERNGDEESKAIPFAPAIAVSTGICLLAGEQLISWYLSLFW